MPPNLDIYVLSRERDRKTIESYLNTYVDRAASEDRGTEQLMILPLDATSLPLNRTDWDWEPAKSLTSAVERGLQFPRRAFSVYLKALDNSLAGAILAFTVDNQVVFGLSLNDEGGKPENLERAKTLMHDMAKALGGHTGFIGVEEPPPLQGKRYAPHISVYSWSGN